MSFAKTFAICEEDDEEEENKKQISEFLRDLERNEEKKALRNQQVVCQIVLNRIN